MTVRPRNINPPKKDKVLNVTLHWDTLIERSLASFVGGLTAGAVLIIARILF